MGYETYLHVGKASQVSGCRFIEIDGVYRSVYDITYKDKIDLKEGERHFVWYEADGDTSHESVIKNPEIIEADWLSRQQTFDLCKVAYNNSIQEIDNKTDEELGLVCVSGLNGLEIIRDAYGNFLRVHTIQNTIEAFENSGIEDHGLFAGCLAALKTYVKHYPDWVCVFEGH